MPRYDTNRSGMLEVNQLQIFLTELNDGFPATLEEAQDIIEEVDKSKTGAVNHDELQPAIQSWFVKCAIAKDAAEKKQKSATCIVM